MTRTSRARSVAPTDEGTRRSEFTPAGFFALRTPLLAFTSFLAWDRWSLGEGRGRRRLARGRNRGRRALLRRRLRDIVARPPSARRCSSRRPTSTSRSRSGREQGERAGTRVERALVKYLSRMAGRATPFGPSPESPSDESAKRRVSSSRALLRPPALTARRHLSLPFGQRVRSRSSIREALD